MLHLYTVVLSEVMKSYRFFVRMFSLPMDFPDCEEYAVHVHVTELEFKSHGS